MSQTETLAKMEQTVVDNLISELESGNLPIWEKDWLTLGLPSNFESKHEYSGANIFLLLFSRQRGGYSSNYWVTSAACRKLGARILKGEKSTFIQRPLNGKVIRERDRSTGEETMKTLPATRFGCTPVFNLDQTTIDAPAVDLTPTGKSNKRAEKCIADFDVETVYMGDAAFYSLRDDKVTLPESFTSLSGKYSTAFHEFGHATAHKSRLDRKLSGVFGSPSYAREELVAELCSAFTCAHFRVEGELQHASYIQHWITLLKENKHALFSACSNADKASQFIRA